MMRLETGTTSSLMMMMITVMIMTDLEDLMTGHHLLVVKTVSFSPFFSPSIPSPCSNVVVPITVLLNVMPELR